MAFALPAYPLPTKARPRLLSAATNPESPPGVERQRFVGPGSRYAIDVTLPPMGFHNARLWVAALLRAESETVTWRWPQPGFANGDSSVSGQTEATVGAFTSANARVLPVAGGPVRTILAGQFFNVVGPNAWPYLHACVQTNNVPGAIRIAPALRLDLQPGAVVGFSTPTVAGRIADPSNPWDVDSAHHYGIGFTLEELR